MPRSAHTRSRFRSPLAVAVLCVAVGTPTSATAEDLETVGRAYMDAWANLDYEKAASFLTPSSRFEDPTSVAFGEPWRHTGPEEIVGFFRGSNEQYKTLSITNRYEKLASSGPWLVLRYSAEVESCAVVAGFPDRVMVGTIYVVTALRIEEGKVLEHLDYADYDRVARDLEPMRARLASQPPDTRCQGEPGNEPR